MATRSRASTPPKPLEPMQAALEAGARRLPELHLQKILARRPEGQPAVRRAMIDPALSAALIRAEAWKRRLLAGDVESLTVIAKAECVTPEYARRMIRPAYLAPNLKASILDGRQPSGFTLEAITKTEMPLDWNDQRRLYAA